MQSSPDEMSTPGHDSAKWNQKKKIDRNALIPKLTFGYGLGLGVSHQPDVKLGFDPGLKRLTCLPTLKSWDTTKQSVCGWQYIYIYTWKNKFCIGSIDWMELNVYQPANGYFLPRGYESHPLFMLIFFRSCFRKVYFHTVQSNMNNL